MPDDVTVTEETTDETILYGCDFDSMTAQAMNGKDVIAIVTNKEGDELLAIAGQQGLSFNMSQETTDAGATKDGGNGWTMRFHGSKSWDASIDGLYSPDDTAQQRVAKAIVDDEYLCLKICKRTVEDDNSITYQPLRMGLAIVTSDNFSAGMDDSATYSMDFSGSGECWVYETATTEERAAAAWNTGGGNSSDTEG